MKRATVADGENRSVELEVADVLLQLQHKDYPSTDAPTDRGPQGGGVVGHRDHSFVPTATPLHRAASVPTSRSLTRSHQDTAIHHLASTTTTTTPSAASSFEPEQMQHISTTSSVPRRLGIDFLLNHPSAPSSSSPSTPPSPSSSPELSFGRHGSWPPRPYYIIEEENTATSQGGATRRADPQGHSTKSERDYIVIEEEEEEENDYALRSPLEEGETATQTDRCLSSSDEDYDEAGGPPPVLAGYGLASMATTTRDAATTSSSSASRQPQRPLAPAPQPPLGGEDHRRPPPDSAARKSLNEKLRQRLEEKRRRSVEQATKATSPSSSSTSPSADQEVHSAGRRGSTSTREAGDEEEQQAGSTRGSSRVGAANLSTPGGRRGVASKKELDIWEQLMLTSVIQPLLPSSSSSHSHPTPTLSSSLPSTLSSSSSSSSSRRGRHQQPEAPVTCMCALGPPPGLAAYPYVSHGHNHSQLSALPHWGSPPPLAEELHLSADLFLDGHDYDYGSVSRYRAEERKRKREPKNESDDEGGHYYYESHPRHLARSVPAYQSQAYDHYRQSRRPRLDPSDQPSALLTHPHEAGRRCDLSSPRRRRDRSALVFHHHTGAPVLDARTRLPSSE